MAMIGQRMTADEYLALPLEDWPRSELIDGEIVMDDPILRHQRIVGWLYHQLTLWTEAAAGRGEAGLGVNHRIDDANVYIPDLWWVPEPPPREMRRFVDVVGIAVEVTSPSTRRRDLVLKRERYGAAGLDELWVVDQQQERVVAHRRPDFDVPVVLVAGDRLTSPLLPGFAVAVEELFDR